MCCFSLLYSFFFIFEKSHLMGHLIEFQYLHIICGLYIKPAVFTLSALKSVRKEELKGYSSKDDGKMFFNVILRRKLKYIKKLTK